MPRALVHAIVLAVVRERAASVGALAVLETPFVSIWRVGLSLLRARAGAWRLAKEYAWERILHLVIDTPDWNDVFRHKLAPC